MSDLADLVALNRLIVCVEIGHLQQNFTEANGFSEVNAILCTGDAGLLPTDCVVQDLYSEQRSDSSHCRISSRLSVGVNRSDEVWSQ
jgi:hypothetical protein